MPPASARRFSTSGPTNDRRERLASRRLITDPSSPERTIHVRRNRPRITVQLKTAGHTPPQPTRSLRSLIHRQNRALTSLHSLRSRLTPFAVFSRAEGPLERFAGPSVPRYSHRGRPREGLSRDLEVPKALRRLVGAAKPLRDDETPSASRTTLPLVAPRTARADLARVARQRRAHGSFLPVRVRSPPFSRRASLPRANRNSSRVSVCRVSPHHPRRRAACRPRPSRGRAAGCAHRRSRARR